jgi:hypothetical protein
MKAKRNIAVPPKKRKPLEPQESWPPKPKPGKLPEYPLDIIDPPEVLPEITQREIVDFATAHTIFQMARADFEARRAALTIKLLRCCHCEQGHHFARLEDEDRLIIEDRTSLEVGTGRPIIDLHSVPSGGAA